MLFVRDTFSYEEIMAWCYTARRYGTSHDVNDAWVCADSVHNVGHTVQGPYGAGAYTWL